MSYVNWRKYINAIDPGILFCFEQLDFLMQYNIKVCSVKHIGLKGFIGMDETVAEDRGLLTGLRVTSVCGVLSVESAFPVSVVSHSVYGEV